MPTGPDLQKVAHLAPAGDGIEMDGLLAVPVCLGIPPCPHLGEGGGQCCLHIVRTVRHPELEDEDLLPERHHHVGTAMAGGRLTAHIDADGPESHVQETGIPGLVAHEIPRRMPLVGNSGQPEPERGGETGKIVGLESVVESSGLFQGHTVPCIKVGQKFVIQTEPDFPIGIVQPIGGPVTLPLFVDDGQVAGLEQQGLDADVIDIEPGDQGSFGPPALDLLQTDRAFRVSNRNVGEPVSNQ